MRQCDMRATAKASDGMLLSGVPIRGCRSPLPVRLPLGPTFAFPEIGLGLLPTAAGERATGTPTSVTALGGILVGDSRVEAGASESWPAMSDGESGFLTNYSRSGPTIIRDYSRRPRPGSGPDRTRPHFARIKVTQMPGLRVQARA
jgi:hypothetical protein